MRFLIVDDSKMARKAVSRCIREAALGELVIEEAPDGLTALKQIAQSSPDVLLTDWNMPHMSGLELARHVRSADAAIRIGFITSEGTDAMRHDAVESGADFFITKPFSPEALKAALEAVRR
ncbi:MAG: response regulator [Myxococcaceae bacterium]|nr:response regulator [Myxococcaceae bacterium]